MSKAVKEKLVFLKSAGESLASQNSALIEYALSGLQRCWLPKHGRWSHIYHLDGRESPNKSIPHSDVFYTLNVLLGMSQISRIPEAINVKDVFACNASQLVTLPVPKYAFGMALWAAAKLRLEIPQEVMQEITELLADQGNWQSFRAQDTGMLLTGIVAQAAAGRRELWRFAGPLFSFLTERYRGDSNLFFDTPSGYRRRFSSFATQTYLTIACYHYGEFMEDPVAIAMANACARRLIALQGPQGEWPWFFDAVRGEVVDFYEVYSVHQYGMAPAFLEFAERHGVSEARGAMIKGFNWVFGENQLSKSMLLPGLQLSFRSQIRKSELHSKKRRVLRAVANAYLRKPSKLIAPANIGVRLECRSYELGWILWSFGQRTDVGQLTESPAFSEAPP